MNVFKMKCLAAVCLLLIVLFTCTQCANILMISTVPSPSHHIWNKRLAIGLIAKDHNITILTHENDQDKLKNFHPIIIKGLYDTMNISEEVVQMAETSTYTSFWEFKRFYSEVEPYSILELESEAVTSLWNYPRKFFDLIIVDAIMGQHLLPFIDRFGNPPVVVATAFLLPPTMNLVMAGHVFPSYMPHYMTSFSNKMTFLERAENFLFQAFDVYYRNTLYMEKAYELAVARFGAENVRPLAEYEKQYALLLSNIDPILDYPVPLPPNIIPVGGLHALPAKPLPTDLKEIMDKATQGVILFSLGTNMKSSFLKPAVKQVLIDTFSELKELVIWKFEEDIHGLPKNVIARKWLPQNDMMAHPNMKLFISHGGALSTQEAMYHGLPVVGIPLFADQSINIERMQNRKLALRLEYKSLNKIDTFMAISEVLTNPIYKKNMMRISGMLKDAPMSGLDKAVYWIEHVLKHGYVEEFRLPLDDMNILSIYSVDLALAAGGVMLILFTFMYCILSLICKKIFGKTASKKKLKTK